MNNPQTSVENRLSDSPAGRFWQELFRNSGQFPIAIILLEFLREGFNYLSKPDFYILVPASAIQAYFLSRRSALSSWEKFFGNLIAPALYSVVETLFEGLEFFAQECRVQMIVQSCLMMLFHLLEALTLSVYSNGKLLFDYLFKTF